MITWIFWSKIIGSFDFDTIRINSIAVSWFLLLAYPKQKVFFMVRSTFMYHLKVRRCPSSLVTQLYKGWYWMFTWKKYYTIIIYTKLRYFYQILELYWQCSIFLLFILSLPSQKIGTEGIGFFCVWYHFCRSFLCLFWC